MIELRTTNPRGIVCGISHPSCKYSDATVARAKELRAQGMTLQAIADCLGLPNRVTVWNWTTGRSRKPYARISAKRVRPSVKNAKDIQNTVEAKAPTTDVESLENAVAAMVQSDVCNSVSIKHLKST